MKIGVIGCGIVGSSTLKAFKVKGFNVLGFDISGDVQRGLESELGPDCVAARLEQLCSCDLVFSCVPTEPRTDDGGGCDLSIFETVVREVAALENSPQYRCRVFVQRSTCPPGTARNYSGLFSKTRYAVNPSFLAKRTEWQDSINPVRIAYAGPKPALELLDHVYEFFPDSPRFVTECFEAVELLKYVDNITDAVLISLWNEFLGMSDSLHISRAEFVRMIEAFVQRPRFATTVRIPGKAFGLWCLPKDLAAVLCEASRGGNLAHVMRGAEQTNACMQENHGTNTTATTELFDVVDGRIVLSDVGRRYLLGG